MFFVMVEARGKRALSAVAAIKLCLAESSLEPSLHDLQSGGREPDRKL